MRHQVMSWTVVVLAVFSDEEATFAVFSAEISRV